MRVKTGDKVPVSGQYKPVGGNTESTFVKDKIVPPTKTPNQQWILVDKTKHKK